MERLSDRELRIMRIVWDNPDCDLAFVMNTYNNRYNTQLKMQTIATFMIRIKKKGYIDITKRDRFSHYTAKVSDTEYRETILPELHYLLGYKEH